MNYFTALVGLQPSATAVALKTWCRRYRPPDRVLLMATPQVITGGQAERLRQFCFGFTALCDVVPISPNLDRADPHSAPEVADRLINEWHASGPGHFIFCGDPGPKYLVVAISRRLPPEVVCLHADVERLFVRADVNGAEIWGSAPLENLGLDVLLALYDLVPRQSSRMSVSLRNVLRKFRNSVPAHAVEGLAFRDCDAFSLDLAYERRGWLFGLSWVGDGNSKEQVRAVVRLSTELSRLQPVLAIMTRDAYGRARARSAGIRALPETSAALTDWLQSKMPQDAILDAITSEEPRVCDGAGGSGPPLVVWVGLDPSATLTSLFTHQPNSACILYDATTPRVIEVARRLQEVASALPVGRLRFIPSDLLGRGAMEPLRRYLPPDTLVRADVTPGRKAQGCLLARIPGVQLWSLRAAAREAVALEGEGRKQLQGPDLLTLARIQGGLLRNSGADACRWGRRRLEFLLLMGRFLTALIKREGRRIALDPLRNISLPEGELRIDSHGQALLKFGDESKKGSLQLRGGFWFEEVIAATFVTAGADEVRVGMEWEWPAEILERPRTKPLSQRDEIDIVARFGPRVVAVSCKMERKPSIAAARREIVSAALTCLGRFALPLLVLQRFASPLPMDQASATVVDLAMLHEVPLRDTLDRIWTARSTFSEA